MLFPEDVFVYLFIYVYKHVQLSRQIESLQQINKTIKNKKYMQTKYSRFILYNDKDL